MTATITEYPTRHGSAWDRGSADSYYHRQPRPHYFQGDTYQSVEITALPGSPEWEAYMAGYDHNEQSGHFKDWH